MRRLRLDPDTGAGHSRRTTETPRLQFSSWPPYDVSLLVYNVPWSCKVFTLGQDERTFCNLSEILPKSFYNSDKTKCPKLGVRVPPDVSTSLLIT